jgi:hypothetical protein
MQLKTFGQFFRSESRERLGMIRVGNGLSIGNVVLLGDSAIFMNHSTTLTAIVGVATIQLQTIYCLTISSLKSSVVVGNGSHAVIKISRSDST